MRLVRPRSVVTEIPKGFAAIRKNAGVKSGSLTQSGSVNASSGQTISNLFIRGGQVYVGAQQDVTIRNCHFVGDGSEYFAIQCDSGSVTIEDCTFEGFYKDSAVSYGGVTMRRCEIVGMYTDGVKIGSNCLHEANWIHGFAPAQGAHSDGMQIYEKVGNVIVRNNVVEVGLGGTWNANDAIDQSTNSALILNESLATGTPGPVEIAGNLLGGGGFSVYMTLPSSTTTFTGNQFIRNSYRWGVLDDRVHATTWSNNTYSDTGAQIAMPA